jgi:hypothetical protein
VVVPLFHSDSLSFFDVEGLRAAARDFIHRTPLVISAGAGHREAAVALHIGFWPFVRDFELAIDQHGLPRAPLMKKFAGGRAGQPEGASVRATIIALANAVREMKEEEGSHAAHWIKDAQHLGLSDLDSNTLPAVQALIHAALTLDDVEFFAALAGTELVAEELSAYLVAAKPYTDLFDRQRWVWGEIHMAPHDHGPSHLEIDLDLARAFSSSDAEAKPRVEGLVRRVIQLFEAAALEVHARYGQEETLLKAA